MSDRRIVETSDQLNRRIIETEAEEHFAQLRGDAKEVLVYWRKKCRDGLVTLHKKKNRRYCPIRGNLVKVTPHQKLVTKNHPKWRTQRSKALALLEKVDLLERRWWKTYKEELANA